MSTKKSKETAKNLRIIDDALFRLIAGDKEVCQEILRVLLDDEDLIVIQAKTQTNIPSLHREVTLDALCKIGEKYVNVEVQKGTGNDDIRRTRFHLSAITANGTPKGTDFEHVPDVTVIYITEYDALRNGQVFTVSEMCTLVEDYAKDYAKDAVKANTKEIARKLLQTGADVAYVIKCTGPSQEDILEIKEEENL